MQARISASLIGLLLLAPAAQSNDESRWAGSVDAGYTASGGNSDSSTFTGAITGKKSSGKLTHHLEARGKNTTESNVRTSESYRVSGKQDVALAEANYLFVTAAWDRDRFNGFEWQATAAAGYGHKFISTSAQQLSAEIGPGYHHDELPGNAEDRAVVYAAANYAWQFAANSQFSQKFSAERGEDDLVSRSLSELAVKMNSRLALKFTLDIRRTDAPAPGARNSDRTTAMALAWTY
jgi:putative salt-induced outer membrane protein